MCLSKIIFNLFSENDKTGDKSRDANVKKFKESKLLYKIMLI